MGTRNAILVWGGYLVGGNTTVIEPGGCAWPTGYRLGRVHVLLQPRGLEQVDGVTVPAGWHAAEPPPGFGYAALIGVLSSDGVLGKIPASFAASAVIPSLRGICRDDGRNQWDRILFNYPVVLHEPGREI